MPVTDIIVLLGIIFAFLAFSVVLAWGDYQTREIARASRERALTADRVRPMKQTAGPEHVAPVASERAKATVGA